MNHCFPNARPAIPAFRSSPAHQAQQRPTNCNVRANFLDANHMREAERAASIRRQHGVVWNAFAGCDRAPFGWEKV